LRRLCPLGTRRKGLGGCFWGFVEGEGGRETVEGTEDEEEDEEMGGMEGEDGGDGVGAVAGGVEGLVL
jgi:hypothetical protein